MSAVLIVSTLLRRDGDVVAIVGDRVFSIVAPQGAPAPHVVLGMSGERDEQILVGAGRYPETRATVACIATTPTAAIELGETVKRAIEDINSAVVDNDSPAAFRFEATIFKDGADVTDHSDDRTIFRRVIDFRVRWRNAA